MASGRIRIQVAADEPQFVHATLKLGGAVHGCDARGLRQLTDADEVVGIQRNHAMNQIVAALSPAPAGRFIADVVRHGGCARRENRQVRAAGALQLQLGVLQAVANLVVADLGQSGQRDVDAAFESRDLLIAKGLQPRRRRGVVTVAIDNHEKALTPNTYALGCPPGCVAAWPGPGRSVRTDPPARRRSACPW